VVSVSRRSSGRGQAQRLSVTYCPIDQLKANPDNPRIHTDRQVKQIARSLETFGPIVPVLIDRNSRVIAGHGRILAARLLGLKDFPTIRVEHLSDAQIKAFSTADNKLTENSSWDVALLGKQLKALAEVELDFSLEATGFEMGEIDVLIEGLEPSNEDEPDAADSISDQAGPRVTNSGDLWELGKHRVLCGNALEPEAYSRLLDKRAADLIFTDPPYNVRIDGHASGLGKKRHNNFAMASGEMSKPEFTDFLSCVFKLLVRHSRDGSIHFVCMDWRHMGELLRQARRLTMSSNNCVYGPSPMPAWVRCTGASTNLSSFSKTAGRVTGTTFNWASSVAIAPTSGITRVLTHFRAPQKKATCWSCIRL
jgi:ParB-like chromosome segregation protein Spo0J